MRKTSKIISFAAAAALLLSGCGVINSPSGTEREKDITTPANTSEVTEDVTTTTATTTTATAAVETTADTSESEEFITAPVLTENKYQDAYYAGCPVLTIDEALRDIDGIREYDYSSDDMEAVIGHLLAGNSICLGMYMFDECKLLIDDPESVYIWEGSDIFESLTDLRDFTDRIYIDGFAEDMIEKRRIVETEEGKPASSGIGTVGLRDITGEHSWFNITDVSDNQCSFLFFCPSDGEKDMINYDVYEFCAVKENGGWKLPRFVCEETDCLVGSIDKCDALAGAEMRRLTYLGSHNSLEENYIRVMRDHFRGVWTTESTNFNGRYYVLGVNGNYDYEDDQGNALIWYGDHPIYAYADDEKAELYFTTDFIANIIHYCVYADEPDVMIVEDLYGNYSDGNYTKRTETYTRVDDAEPYPDKGAFTFYLARKLDCRHFRQSEHCVMIEYDGFEYNNDDRYRDGPPRELRLIEDNGDSIILSSLFHRGEDRDAPYERRFKYEMHRTDEGVWELGDFEDLKDDTIAYVSKEHINNSDRYTLHIPANCTDPDVGALINELTNTEIELDPDNTFFTLKDGCLFSLDMTVLYAAPYDAEDPYPYDEPIAPVTVKIYTVPESVTYIAPHAFYKGSSARTLDVIYAGDKITDENIAALDLYYMTEVWLSQATRALIGTQPRRGPGWRSYD